MHTTEYAARIGEELNEALRALPLAASEQLAERILASRKIFVAGAGRSGLMARAFSMRLMHLGLESFVIGETASPGFGPQDLLIAGSGSGETKTLIAIMEKAKSLGGTAAVVTINPDSTLGRLADLVVKLPGATKDKTADAETTIQPMGSLYEQTLLLFFDAIILRMMEKRGLNSAAMYGNHANLE